MSTTTNTSASLPGATPPQQRLAAPADTSAMPSAGWTPEWGDRFGAVLAQLGYAPDAIQAQLAMASAADLTTAELEESLAELNLELEVRVASQAWRAAVAVCPVPGAPVPAPGQGPVSQVPAWELPPPTPRPIPPVVPVPPGAPTGPGQGPIGSPPQVPPPSTQPPTKPPVEDPELPPSGPPQVPPPDSGQPPTKPDPDGPGVPGVPGTPPTGPGAPTEPPPTEPPPPGKDPSGDEGGSLKPWLVGAGIVGAGVAGVLAHRTGSHNVRALRAMAASYDSGAMHQGGLQAINDAQMGARFAGGIGTREYLAVALPFVNRLGTGGTLTAMARGHLDHAELLASSAALRRGDGIAVAAHPATRQVVLDGLEGGRSMRSVLDDLDRSADGAKPAFDNRQLVRYWDQASIVERGPRVAGHDVMSGVRVQRPGLAIQDGIIVETGGQVPVNQLVAGRGASLGDRGLAEGIGTIQGRNLSTLNPAMQERAIVESGVDPRLVDAVGLDGAFTQRWRERLAAGELQPPPQ